jgi:hypothetical protein
VAPSTSAGPQPGQPYAAADILEAMRTTPRPDGVPEELQTDAIAGAIAESIWTIDGEPWDPILISASCGETCLVEVAGSRPGAAGDDLWTFEVDPSTGQVGVLVDAVVLNAIPETLLGDLDRQTRSIVDAGDLEGLALASAAWMPPPDAGVFALSYRSGDEEGSCGVDLVLDTGRAEVTDVRRSGTC